jgi:hypothetical protein
MNDSDRVYANGWGVDLLTTTRKELTTRINLVRRIEVVGNGSVDSIKIYQETDRIFWTSCPTDIA